MSVKCTSCGSELLAQVKFCTQCGAVVSQAKAASPSDSGIGQTEDLSVTTQPLMAEEKSYATNVYTLPQGAMEELYAAAQASVGKTTQELTPVTGALEGNLAKTSLVSHTPTGTLPASAPANASSKSGGRAPLAIGAIVLLIVVGVAGIYALRNQTSSSPDSSETSFASQSIVVQSQPSPTLSNIQKKNENEASKTLQAESVEKEKAGTIEPVSKQQDADVDRKSGKASLPKETATTDQGKMSAAELLQRGLDAQNSGRYQEALGEFQKALQQDPGNVSIYYLIGTTHHRLGQLEQALAAYRQCTSGAYASVSAQHVKTLEKKLSKSKY